MKAGIGKNQVVKAFNLRGKKYDRGDLIVISNAAGGKYRVVNENTGKGQTLSKRELAKLGRNLKKA